MPIRKQMAVAAIAVGLSCSAPWSWAQAPSAGYSVLDLMVWGADLIVDPTPYPPDVRLEIERHLQRWRVYTSPHRRPADSPELEMIHFAQVRYERRLVAASSNPRADSLAVAYVDKLRPCYEWEGFHDCPEREAVFATEYNAANPDGPFREYLPLLAAHRWLCTAEGYEYENRPDEADRSRRAYEQAVAKARQSAAVLIRRAADELVARGRC